MDNRQIKWFMVIWVTSSKQKKENIPKEMIIQGFTLALDDSIRNSYEQL